MALPALAQEGLLSVAEYLLLEGKSQQKNEFFDGHLIAMAGASRRHSQIQTNLLRILSSALRETASRCAVHGSDLRLKCAPTRYFYPDIAIYCREDAFEDESTGRAPEVIIEILSSSTESFDRGEKARAYRQIDSLRQLVFVDPAGQAIEIMVREGEQWSFSETRSGQVQIGPVLCDLAEVFFQP